MPETTSPNVEPLKYSLDFEVYLLQVFNSFAGMKGKLTKLDTGEYIVEYEQDENSAPIGNDKGGKYLVSNLRLIMNRHAGFGSLSRDEIAEVCGNIIRATITPMFVWTDEYGIKSLSVLENFGLNLFESLYTYLTSLKETKGGSGGLLEFGKEITSVTYVPRQAQAQQPQGLYAQ